MKTQWQHRPLKSNRLRCSTVVISTSSAQHNKTECFHHVGHEPRKTCLVRHDTDSVLLENSRSDFPHPLRALDERAYRQILQEEYNQDENTQPDPWEERRASRAEVVDALDNLVTNARALAMKTDSAPVSLHVQSALWGRQPCHRRIHIRLVRWPWIH